jgi:hypothetical protein
VLILAFSKEATLLVFDQSWGAWGIKRVASLDNPREATLKRHDEGYLELENDNRVGVVLTWGSCPWFVL